MKYLKSTILDSPLLNNSEIVYSLISFIFSILGMLLNPFIVSAFNYRDILPISPEESLDDLLPSSSPISQGNIQSILQVSFVVRKDTNPIRIHLF